MRRRGSYALVAGEGYRALRLPYEVEALGMVIVLPDAVDGVAGVGAQLGEAQLSDLFAAIRAAPPRQVELALPRFKLESKIELAPLFQQAGMTLAFERPGRLQRHDRTAAGARSRSARSCTAP